MVAYAEEYGTCGFNKRRNLEVKVVINNPPPPEAPPVAPKAAEGYNGLMGSKANDRQVGGLHYKSGAGPCPHCGKPIQHWDLAAMFGWDYFQGQITKYVMRWRSKNGLQDLEKGGHVLQKYLETERARVQSESGAEPESHGYVHQDGSRKEALRREMDSRQPNSQTDDVVCGKCKKVFHGIYQYDTHECR